MNVLIEPFGTTLSGEHVDCLALRRGQLSVKILTLGAILQDVRLVGVPYSLTLGSIDLRAYEGPMAYFGAIVGPVANRIAFAKAIIDGQLYKFPANEHGQTTLHGGPKGLHARVWTVTDQTACSARLTIALTDGEGGFPGNREISALYEVLENERFSMTFTATTDRTTPIAMANHSYWNLDGTNDTDGHSLRVAAAHYLPTNDLQIPTGEIVDVTDSAFDFRTPRRIGAGQPDRIDHNMCLSDGHMPLRNVATLMGSSGVTVNLETTETGLQIYDASGVKSAPFTGHGGFVHQPFCGIAMEAQGWPNAVNQPQFPQITVQPGQTYTQITRLTFNNGRP